MKTKPLMLTLTSAAVLFCALGTLPVSAQPAVPPLAPVYQPLSNEQLDQLLGPIALYPDPLLGEILPAAAFPTEIVLADRYVSGGGDPSLLDEQPWDASVVALAHYPTVLRYMDDNLAWTTALGLAFLYQQQQVMESIQRLRLSAENYGNLVSTPQEEVVNDNGCVEILPAEPDVIYVPVYQTQYVYCQSGFGVGYGVSCTLGPWLTCDFDWVHHNLRFWDSHRRPANWWQERPEQRQAAIAARTTPWHPENHQTVAAGQGWNNQGANHPAPVLTQTSQMRERQQQLQQRIQQSQQQAQQHMQQAPQQMQQRMQQIQQHNATAFNQQRPAPTFQSPPPSRTFTEHSQQSFGAVTRPEPVQTHVDPPQFHAAPVQPHIEAPAPAPAPAPVQRSAPPAESGGGGGGGSHGGSRR